MTVAPAIDVRGLLVVRGGREVVRGLSFEVATGTVTGLVGPSGCGKTTLMRSIVGVQRVSGGSVTVLGLPGGSPPLRRRIGYVTQAPALYWDLTVRENLRYFARVLDADPERVDELVDRLRLRPVADQVVRTLSGGERARASLGVALVGSPELLVLDEPTVGLDPVLRMQLWELFNGLAATGVTLLVSSHVMDEAGRCERLLLMREGELVAAQSPDEIRRSTGTEDLEQAFIQLAESRA